MPENKPFDPEDLGLLRIPTPPESPTSSVGPNSSLGSIADGAYGDPPKDTIVETVQIAEPPPKPSTLGEKLYFHIALLGRKTKVWFADLFRNSEEAHKPGAKNTWFNQVKLSDSGKDKTLYLGMIPDDVTKRKIPAAAKYVSILQPFEVNYMDKNIHSDFKATVHSEDNVGMSFDDIDRGVEALKKAIDAKDTQPIYLHCKSGVGRSATVLAAYLMKYRGMSLKDAIDRVQQDRPDAQLRGSKGDDTKHTKALRAFEEALIVSRNLVDVKASEEESALVKKAIYEDPELRSILAGQQGKELRDSIEDVVEKDLFQRLDNFGATQALIERLRQLFLTRGNNERENAYQFVKQFTNPATHNDIRVEDYPGIGTELLEQNLENHMTPSQLQERLRQVEAYDARHADELRKRIGAQIEKIVEDTAVFLGAGTLSDKEKILFAQMIRQDPVLDSALEGVLRGRTDPALHAQLVDALSGIAKEASIDGLTSEVTARLGSLAFEDTPVAKLAKKIAAPFLERSVVNTQFHTDGFRDGFVNEQDEIKNSTVLGRYIGNKKTFFYDLLSLNPPASTKEKLKKDEVLRNGKAFLKTAQFEAAQKFLKGEFRGIEENPYWDARAESGMITKHAGWEKISVPTGADRSPLTLVRTFGLMDKDRVRVGSVKLHIPDLNSDETAEVMKAIEAKAQNPSGEFGKNLSSELKSRVQEPCEKFLYDCNSKIVQMHGELVGFIGLPDDIAKPMRNVDESN